MNVPVVPSGGGLALTAALALASVSATAAVLVPRRPTLARWVAHRRRSGLGDARRRAAEAGGPAPRVGGVAGAVWSVRTRWAPGDLLAAHVRRAGLSVPPGVAVGFTTLATLAAAGVLAAVAELNWVVVPLPVALAVVAAVPALAAVDLIQRGRRRRATMLGQLPILADLMVLEQTGGGVGFRRALEGVVAQVGGLASDGLQGCLAQSALAGGPHLDDRIDALAREFDLPALASLATVARLQRTEGAAVGPVLRQLASTLRDQQRDALLAAGRRKVVQMLLPTGLCILLPFIALVLYPALARLLGALA